MEIPGLGGWLNRSCTCWPMPQPYHLRATSATYTATHNNTSSFNLLSEARDGTLILIDGFLTCRAVTGTPQEILFLMLYLKYYLFIYLFCLLAISLGRFRGIWRFPG